jgi:serine/threonine protein kinase
VSANQPATPDPTQIGKFQIVQRLGAGAFGTVYKAQDPELGRFVAIKTIRLEGLAASQASLDDLLARFKREAKVAAGLKHPNIVTIHEIGSLPGNSYLVMEFVDGVGLDRVVAKGGRMSVERAASIGAQVATALAFAHKHNVVHRDIKPANIMIEPGDHVKVTDFGIAKVTDSQVDQLTATGSLLGTPSYMSPEQARGSKVDGRSDLFSLGCVLYEMVAGQKAFRGESITALLFKIITEEPPPLRELDPTVSDEMVRIIAKALQKAPENRYANGQELASDLLALTRPGFVPTLRAIDAPTLPPDAPAGDVPTIAAPPTVRPEPTLASAATLARPSSTSATAPAAAAPPPLPPTVLTPATVRPPSPPASPRPPVAAPARRKGGGAGVVAGLAVAAVLGLAVLVGGGWYLFARRAAPVPAAPPADTAAMEPGPPAEAGAPPEVTSTVADAGPEPTPAPATATASGSVSGSPAAAPIRPRPAGPAVADRGSVPPAPVPPGPGAPPPGDYSHLDELPPDAPDGRAAGEALAGKYRSGGSSGIGAMRFRQRSAVPPGVRPAERPAVSTLLYLHGAQEAFHRKEARYGTLRELSDAGLLAVDVPFETSGFVRARYAFRLSVEPDGYRIEALPQPGPGRPFVVDDSGFVRVKDEE